MNITILNFGSRGDVEPFLALALGLQRAGHVVTLVAPPQYADWIRSHGVQAYPMQFDFKPSELGPSGHSPGLRESLRSLRDTARQVTWDSLEDYRQASQNADYVIQNAFVPGGVEIAGQRDIPIVFVQLSPYTPTVDFPAFNLAYRRSGGAAYNRWTQRVFLNLTWRLYGPTLNRWRAQFFGLPPWRSYSEMIAFRHSLGAPNLLNYSTSVLPKPSDWDATHQLTGHWFLDPPQDWQPPDDLLAFLESGPAPVYVGFGSMAHGDSAHRTREVLRALEISGQRGVILCGGGGALARLPAPETVFYIDNVPHAWLFPRMAALVHHGGGSVFSGLRSGVPSVIAPLDWDQHTWAELVERLGIGIRLPSLKRLNAGKLAAAITTAIRDVSMRQRAAMLGEKIRAEDGVGRAVEIIERHAVEFRERRSQEDTTR